MHVVKRDVLLLKAWDLLSQNTVFIVLTLGKKAWAIIKVLDHRHQWLAGGYDLEIGDF